MLCHTRLPKFCVVVAFRAITNSSTDSDHKLATLSTHIAFHKLAPSCHNYVKDCHKLDFCLSLCLFNIAVTNITNCHKLANFRLSD
jgi:hypothetical protein